MDYFELLFDPSKRHLLPDHSHCVSCTQKILRKVNVFIHDGKAYHAKCFRCARCQHVISGPEGFETTDGEPRCVKCAIEIEAEPCFRCSNDVEDTVVVYGSHHYHPQCFVCSKCQNNFLETGKYYPKDKNVYCKGCYLELFLHKCTSCHAQLLPDSQYVEMGGVRYHPTCFNCRRCRKNLMRDGYYGEVAENLYFCLECGKILKMDVQDKKPSEEEVEKDGDKERYEDYEEDVKDVEQTAEPEDEYWGYADDTYDNEYYDEYDENYSRDYSANYSGNYSARSKSTSTTATAATVATVATSRTAREEAKADQKRGTKTTKKQDRITKEQHRRTKEQDRRARKKHSTSSQRHPLKTKHQATAKRTASRFKITSASSTSASSALTPRQTETQTRSSTLTSLTSFPPKTFDWLKVPANQVEERFSQKPFHFLRK